MSSKSAGSPDSGGIIYIDNLQQGMGNVLLIYKLIVIEVNKTIYTENTYEKI